MHTDDDLRLRVRALAAEVGGQRPLGRLLGLNQSVISRFVTGGRLSITLARRLHTRYPALREPVRAVHLSDDDMPMGTDESAVAAAS